MTSTPVAERPASTLGFPRLLVDVGHSYQAHVAALGPLRAPSHLVDELARSGLTGRGGAAFPTATKFRAMAPRGIVVGNGSEGEPLSVKDELLLNQRPHLVLDGLIASAHAVRAREAHLVVGPSSEDSVRRAISERRDAESVRVTVTEDRFVSGEASAVVNLLTSGNALPVDHAVRLTTKGLRGRPTLVQNVETLAHVALIARYGADRFRSIGTETDPGTRLFSIAGDVERSGVTEGPGGATLRSVLAAARPGPIAGVLVGGYHGTWVGPDALDRPVGSGGGRGSIPAGAGILLVVGQHDCGLRVTSEIAGYLAAETAGQCGPCVNGLPALAEMTSMLARRDRDPRIPQEIQKLIRLVDGRGACHHPDGTARMIASAMQAFAADVGAHLRGTCTAGRR
ncbi:NADH-ubiquinone oxidoreductase-F iron-sulfur binding region domain-containing protein [Amnibacterium sp.]|uniref:NADH-ubiquinone oxidoreductase-F iron-sulfur binding region domain-containing protein n=1 Tax=Amnibacterium sp. TaxID=1872496 RepID=UPI003F7C4E59